ncbi:septum formation family protein [Micromonospora sp. WMMA1998]|uniref:septum formation family protein n=1 Tax=Micromonospora sp. WMMA1998 TaxID=3015167 RepID=UPI00248C9E72|nr:septum formation family protein [Micromonospora sp. WMMA1998]WBC17294.1 septum formation family protein [Micromonospora sp. WMMA1998]
MRLRAVLTLLAIFVLVPVTACDALGGPPPSGFRPQAGMCHLKPGDNADGDAYRPVRCTERHEAETVMVGAFAGEDAESDGPPATGSLAAVRAYWSCTAGASDFLGDDVAEGRLSVRLVLPTADGWAADERWYRCDVVEFVALDLYEPNPRANSLRGALESPSSPLRHACYTAALDEYGAITSLPPASCTGPHRTEFAGVWRDDSVPYGEEIPSDTMMNGCYGVIARHVGLGEDDEIRRRLRPLFLPPREEDLAAGEQRVLCLLHSDGRKLTRSLAGVGVRGLPPRR